MSGAGRPWTSQRRPEVSETASRPELDDDGSGTASAAPTAVTSDVEARAGATVLVVDDDPAVRELVTAVLKHDGHRVVSAEDGRAALACLAETSPDLVVCDVNMPEMDGFTFAEHLRADPRHRWLPLIFLTTRRGLDDVVQGLALGGDDYVTKPFAPQELVARVRGKLARPPVPVDLLPVDRRSGLLSWSRFVEELEREHGRAARGGASGVVGVLALSELPGVRQRLGPGIAEELVREVGRRLGATMRPLDLAARLDDDHLAVLLPETSPSEAERRLLALQERLAGTPFEVRGERLRVTPSSGLVAFTDAPTPDLAHQRAAIAADHAVAHLDLLPQRWTEAMDAEAAARRAARQRQRAASPLGRFYDRFRVPIQIAITLVVGLVLPFVAYWQLDVAGYDVTRTMYLVVVVVLLVTGLLIWAEGIAATRVDEPPDEPAEPEPPATAIVAAFLPNEAATIVETVEAFRRLDYPAGLQIIVAYNTPDPLPVERELQALADEDPRILPLKVEGSTSKAQNVNAALEHATGRVVGMFDADHHPDPDAFRRAWRWLSHGDDVVQGHCLVRNGDESHVARLVAVEFEAIYAVSHPGRARLHGFGVFGGSNGFWRTDLLHQIRMRGRMLTEDIDSSLRVIEAGGRIRSDPGLISRELATTTWQQLWNQRMRWAQGWFQVSMRHLWRGLRSPHLTLRQKLGLVHLLGWREVYPWLSLQMFPIVAYWIWRDDPLDWFVPIFVLTTLFTLSVGPFQTWFAYRLGHPSIRANRRWYWWYLLEASLFYTEYKNVIARVSQVKEALRERAWKVTPRSNPPAPPGP
jgi:PleD family two-component response regulator/cellulose synthase/poly-beta-1,6-N-acetylglucosamine synthase-like glycosyltransferase